MSNLELAMMMTHESLCLFQGVQFTNVQDMQVVLNKSDDA